MPLPHRSRPFGDLEATVMDLLWSADRPLLVREVLDLLPARPSRPRSSQPLRCRLSITVITVV